MASFRKSGNTWVRAVWAAYVADGEPALTRLEERGAFPEKSELARSGRFFRRGREHFWPNVLSRRQAAAVIEQHGEIMTKLGYELPDLQRVYEHV